MTVMTADRFPHQTGTIGDSECNEQPRDVPLRRLFADRQLRRDFLGGVTLHDQTKNVRLSGGELSTPWSANGPYWP